MGGRCIYIHNLVSEWVRSGISKRCGKGVAEGYIHGVYVHYLSSFYFAGPD